MSIERDLLGRWHNGDLLPEEYMALMKETKELLAQPEHIPDIRNMVEPVAWMSLSDIEWMNIVNSPKAHGITGGGE